VLGRLVKLASHVVPWPSSLAVPLSEPWTPVPAGRVAINVVPTGLVSTSGAGVAALGAKVGAAFDCEAKSVRMTTWISERVVIVSMLKNAQSQFKVLVEK
jgi:hypothetical protein